MDQVLSIRPFMLLMFKASQGAIHSRCFGACVTCLHGLLPLVTMRQMGDGLNWIWKNFFFPLVWGFCNVLGLIQNPTCYDKIQPARWLHDFSCDCCWAGGQPLWISYVSPSFTGWNCLKIQLRFAQWQLGSWEDGSWSFPAILLWASRFWSATSPPFPLEPLPRYGASNHLQSFRTASSVAIARMEAWTSIPQDCSQPVCTGIWHHGFPNVRMPMLGEAGCAYVMMMALLHPKVTTLVPLVQR